MLYQAKIQAKRALSCRLQHVRRTVHGSGAGEDQEGSGRNCLQISGNVPASYRQVSMPLHTVGGLLRYRKRKPLKASPRPSRRPPPCFCTLHALARCFPPFLAFLSTCLRVYMSTRLHVYMFTCLHVYKSR